MSTQSLPAHPVALPANKQLLVVGDLQTVQFFKLIGAVGFEVQTSDPSQLKAAVAYIRQEAPGIGGILVTPSVADDLQERLDRIKHLSVPLIRLPDSQADSQSQVTFLENLMEQAIGMKLERKVSL